MSLIAENVLIIHSAITANQFLRFSYYNELIRKRRYLGLAAFAVLLILFGWCNLITGSHFLFWLFVGTGLAVPGIYLAQFHKSIRAQANALKLNEAPKEAYTVGISKRGICIDRDSRHLSFDWDALDSAHRFSRCTYLYYTPQRAVILPDSCILDGKTGTSASPETLWSLLQEQIPEKIKKNWRTRL